MIDDFTASGTSFIRKDIDQYKGKLTKIIDKFFKPNDNDVCRELFFQNVDVHVVFCLATDFAISHIDKLLREYIKSLGLDEYIN